MRSLVKSLFMVLILVCIFGYVGTADAAEPLSSKEDKTVMDAIYNLLSGKALSEDDKSTISTLQEKYKLYYQYKQIDSDTYNKYKTDSTDSQTVNTITDLIQTPGCDSLSSAVSESEEGKWAVIEGTQVSYSNLKYDSSNPAGYLIMLIADASTDGSSCSSSTLYYSKNVYQATSATTLATYKSIASVGDTGDENEVEKQETDEEEEEDVEKDTEAEEEGDTEEKAETNPETGISDYAVYLVPLALVAGSALYLRRRVA